MHRVGVVGKDDKGWWPDRSLGRVKEFDPLSLAHRRLVAFHLNDSKQPRGARVDRHDNIPAGFLGEQFWSTLMTDKRFAKLCGYLETPLVDENISTWKHELSYLRKLRDDS